MKVPVIYVSFGTMISKADGRQFEILAKVFALLPDYKFIWKYDGSKIEVSDNVMLLKWVPQNDLLGHTKLSLFITHCGVHSSYEIIRHAVPIIALPLFADQPSNAKRLVDRLGMGLALDFHSFTEEQMKHAIQEVLSNSKYRENAQKASTLFINQHTSPRSRLIYSIEHVAQHKNISHLTSPQLYDFNIFQYYSVDILAFLISIVLLLLFLLVYVIRYIVYKIYNVISPKHMKKE